MTDLPAPPVPADADLRDFPSMLLDVVRLRDSELVIHESGDAFKAAVLLWCAAWHQRPAGSLPKDNTSLMRLACVRSHTRWSAIARGALRGWSEFADGRLYHQTVTEKVIAALQTRSRREARTERARSVLAKKRTYSTIPASVTESAATSVADSVTESVTESVTGSKVSEGKGREEENIDAPSGAPASDKKYAFESGVIRLNQRDLDRWKAAYSRLDVPAELMGLTKWAGEQGKSWFHAVQGALTKRNREITARPKEAERKIGSAII